METGVLNQSWAVVLPATSAAALGPLRLTACVQICAIDANIWLRGTSLDEALSRRLLSLPVLDRFNVARDGVLTAWGKLTPGGTLPQGNWQPLDKWFEVVLPARDWPGNRPEKSTLTLVRSTREQQSGALMVLAESWNQYALTAPQIRLEGLAFACNTKGGVLLRGKNLPPLPGQSLVDDAGLFVPAGWTWTPRLPASDVRFLFNLNADECALWLSSTSWQRIPADAWVKASRSAARQSASEATNG